MIGIIDYGMGNIASVSNALDILNIQSTVVSDYHNIKHCDKLILPGVGAFPMAMANLHKFHFFEVLKEDVLIKKKPILGICLGMQLLLSKSEEFGTHDGLDFISGSVKYFKGQIDNLPIPHMGWNDVEISPESNLFRSDDIKPCFYFVHSYYCEVRDEDTITGICEYGIPFHAMVESNNVMGCQFHPEKSQKSGMEIYRSFNTL